MFDLHQPQMEASHVVMEERRNSCMQLLIKNAKLRGRSDLTDISVDGGRIVAIDKAENAAADRVIDAAGSIVTEPMIDPHIHHDKVNVFEKVPKNESGNLFEAIAPSPMVSCFPVPMPMWTPTAGSSPSKAYWNSRTNTRV